MGGDFKVELAARGSQMSSDRVFKTYEERKITSVIPWRRLKERKILQKS